MIAVASENKNTADNKKNANLFKCNQENQCVFTLDGIGAMFGLTYEREMVEESDTDVYDSKAWSESEVSDIKKIEHILSKEGFAATLYLPTKSSKVPKEQGALIKKKKRSDRIECEVKVDDKPKLFRFLISEVDDVSSGKGLSNVVPASVDDNRCMNFLIKGKGELSLVLNTKTDRDKLVKGFKLLTKKYAEHWEDS